MQHRDHATERIEPRHATWHPFSWRRMSSRQGWALLGAAVAFAVIGLIVV